MISISYTGDSITRTQHSADYLAPLRERHRPMAVRTRRFGVTRDFAHNLLQRLDEVVAEPADVITVLIGTNDARASLPDFLVEKLMRVPRYLHVLLQRKVLGRSLDDISARRGLLLTTDHIHQNSRGASLIAEVIDLGVLQVAGPGPMSGRAG